MRICFSTLACPNWTLPQVLEIATASGYQGIELRFLEGEDSLWKLSAFQGTGLSAMKLLTTGAFTLQHCRPWNRHNLCGHELPLPFPGRGRAAALGRGRKTDGGVGGIS